MAIKGKKKKSGGKAKPAAPKRPLVPPKPGLLGRKSVHVAAASLLAFVIGLILGWTFWHGSLGTRPLTKGERARVATARATLDAALAEVGKPAPPTDFFAFPDLTTSLNDFNQGQMSANAFAKAAKRAAGSAKTASTQIGGIDAASITRGFPSETAGEFKTAQEDLKQALQLYQTSSEMLVRAAAASGKDRAALVADATKLRTSGAELLNIGYRYYILVLEAAGLQPISDIPPALTGLPQGNPLPSGVGGLPPAASP